MKKTFVTLVLSLFGVVGIVAQNFNLIPYPQSLKKLGGFNKQTGIVDATYQTDATLAPDAYRLKVGENEIVITSSTEVGRYYGDQTLQQLWMLNLDGGLPCVEIEDEPLFKYRGFHLDISRHFFTKEAIKKVLDVMAFYKINKFHWHLCDDQGWRVEIPEYPRLTEVGSIRKGSLTNKGGATYFYDDTEYGRGCYYTLKDLREVVDYAAERHIEVIPEYDLPGHNVAAIAAYPELSCDTTRTYEVRIMEGISTDVLNVGSDKVIDFLKCVLGHLAETFPSKYMHLGGDECPTAAWENNADCQRRIQEEGLKDVKDLQPWLLETLGSWLRDEYGKEVIAWDELIDRWKPEYTVKPIMMVWRGAQYAANAAAKGLKCIYVPSRPCYFDLMQCTVEQAEVDEVYQGGYGDKEVNSIDKVYAINPVATLQGKEDMCWGPQANLWAESLGSDEQMQYQYFPRMLALAEVGWMEYDRRRWEDFRKRLQSHAAILDWFGVAYGKHYFDQPALTPLEQQRAEANRLLESRDKAGQVGYASEEAYNALLQARKDAVTTEDAEALKAAVEQFKAEALVMPQEGKTYQIKSASTYYKARYEGSTLYRNIDHLCFHYTPQQEPRELWRCEKGADGGYRFVSLLDGKPLVVGGSESVTLRRSTETTKYDYIPGALLIEGGGKVLYAKSTGRAEDDTDTRLMYPGTWRLTEVSDFTAQLRGMLRMAQAERADWQEDTYGYVTADGVAYLDEVIAAVEERVAQGGVVSEEEYQKYADMLQKYMEYPRIGLLESIDEDHYYYIENGYFSGYFAASNGNNMTALASYATDAARWHFIKQADGTMLIRNKEKERSVYVTGSSGGTALKNTTLINTTNAKYGWTLQEVTTDQGNTAIAILDKSGKFSWYSNPNSTTSIVLQPKDWGAAVWNITRIKADLYIDPTGIDSPLSTVNSQLSTTYDLQGRPVQLSSPNAAGLYLQGGRKVLKN